MVVLAVELAASESLLRPPHEKRIASTVQTDESMPPVTERPMPSKGTIVARPGPAWKTTCISAGVAAR